MKSGSPEPSPKGSTIKTLIVDDSALVRASITAFLALEPEVEVIGTAADGREALALMVHRQADLVVMDLNMPVMDGLQALRRIRERHQTTRVLIMTVACDAEVKARCLASGADAFLSKEEIQRELHGVITRLFPNPRPASTPVPKPRRP